MVASPFTQLAAVCGLDLKIEKCKYRSRCAVGVVVITGTSVSVCLSFNVIQLCTHHDTLCSGSSHAIV